MCISATSSLEISFTTNVRSYDASSSPTHTPSSFLTGGLRARETCWLEDDVGRYTHSETANLLRKSQDFSTSAILRSVTLTRQMEDSETSHCSFYVYVLRCTKVWLCKHVLCRAADDAVRHLVHAKYRTNECKCGRQHTRREKAESPEKRLFSIHRLKWGAGGRSQSYLVVLVLDSKSLAQVPEHLRAVLLKFELSWKILSKEQKVFHWISPSSRQV